MLGCVILNFNDAPTTIKLVRSIKNYRVINYLVIVDNHSTDNSFVELKKLEALDCKHIKVIRTVKNGGYGYGNVDRVRLFNGGNHCGRHAVFAFRPVGTLDFGNGRQCIGEHCDAGGNAHASGSAGEVLLGVDLVDEAGVRDTAARRRDPVFAQMLRAPGRASKLGVPPDDAQVLQPVDAVSGALMLLSRPLFDRLDGLDEGYRLHAEDMDLCRRAREAGAVVAVANDIRVLHIRGVSSRARPVFVDWHKHRGLWRYFRKFEAAQCGLPTQLGVFAAIWLHFGAVLARVALRRR